MRIDQARTMAEYNRWMNEKLYAVCATIPDESRKMDRGGFFRSIHGTLNHLLLGDRIWMGRFKGTLFHVASLDEQLFESFEELYAARRKLDQEILDWTNALTEHDLNAKLEFTSFVNRRDRACTLWKAVLHFFNHQTHHRGQLTTLLSQCNVDYGVTDLLWMPGVLDS